MEQDNRLYKTLLNLDLPQPNKEKELVHDREGLSTERQRLASKARLEDLKLKLHSIGIIKTTC